MATKKNVTGRQRLQQAFDAALRVDALVDIASLAATDSFDHLDGAAEDLVDYLLDDGYRVHASAEELRKVAKEAVDGDGGSTDMLGETFIQRGMLGLAVQFATPVMTKSGKSSWSYSWGYTQSTWVYAQTYEEAWQMGVAWAEQCREEAKSAAPKRGRKAVQKDAAGSAA